MAKQHCYVHHRDYTGIDCPECRKDEQDEYQENVTNLLEQISERASQNSFDTEDLKEGLREEIRNSAYYHANPGEYQCPSCLFITLKLSASRCQKCHADIPRKYWEEIEAKVKAAAEEAERRARAAAEEQSRKKREAEEAQRRAEAEAAMAIQKAAEEQARRDKEFKDTLVIIAAVAFFAALLGLLCFAVYVVVMQVVEWVQNLFSWIHTELSVFGGFLFQNRRVIILGVGIGCAVLIVALLVVAIRYPGLKKTPKAQGKERSLQLKAQKKSQRRLEAFVLYALLFLISCLLGALGYGVYRLLIWWHLW